MNWKSPTPDAATKERCLTYLDGLAAVDDHSIQHLTAFRTGPAKMASEIRRGTPLGNDYLEEYAIYEQVERHEAANLLHSFTVAFQDEVRGYRWATGTLAGIRRAIDGAFDMVTLEIEATYGIPARGPRTIGLPPLREAYARRMGFTQEKMVALEEGVTLLERERELRLLRFGKPFPAGAISEELAAIGQRRTELVKGFYGLA